MTSPARVRAQNAGFAYVMLLVAAIVIGILGEAAVFLTSRTLQSERESELLYRGQAYQRAIADFYRARSPHVYPHVLADLVEDPRFAHRHYLRRLYPDPMTADGKWLLVRARDGGIAGVASRSKLKPLKQAGFPRGLEDFADAASYRDWVFMYPMQTEATHTRGKQDQAHGS